MFVVTGNFICLQEQMLTSVNGHGFNIPIKNTQICITVKLIH